MGFAIFCLSTWLIIAIFITMKKNLSIIENTLIYLFILLININESWIIIEELRFVHLTKAPLIYAAYILFRTIVIPIMIVISINEVYQSKSRAKKIIVILISIVAFLFFCGLSTYFHMFKYVKWNYGYDAIYFVLLHILAYIVLKFYRRYAQSEVQQT